MTGGIGGIAIKYLTGCTIAIVLLLYFAHSEAKLNLFNSVLLRHGKCSNNKAVLFIWWGKRKNVVSCICYIIKNYSEQCRFLGWDFWSKMKGAVRRDGVKMP